MVVVLKHSLEFQAQPVAIARQQELAAQERATELAKANEAIQRSLSRLTDEPDLDSFLSHVITEVTNQVEAVAGYVFLFDAAANTLELRMSVREGQAYQGAAAHDHALFHAPFLADITPGFPYVCQTREILLLNLDDFNEMAWPGTVEWHRSMGHREAAFLALMAGDRPVGALGLAFREKTQLKPEELELIHALANQAALAIQLTRLAEEAKQAALAKLNEVIAREQELAATERAAELAKINAALEVEVIARSQAEQLAQGQTEALIKILAGLAAEPNLDSFLGNALRAITKQLGEESAGLWLYDDAHDATILHLNYENGSVHRGAQTNRPAASMHRPLKGWDGEYLAALRQQKVLIHTEQEFASPGYTTSRASYLDRGIKTVLYVSLFFGDRFLGFITIRSRQTRHYPSEEVELAGVLAHQVALAIQLTQLAKQAQQSAVLEERNRLARDIHDTLAQVLTGVIVQLQAAENPYTTDPRDRQEHLAQAHLLAKQGLSEARRSIRALRSQILEATDFASALTNLAEQMAIGTGLQVHCQIEAIPYWLEPEVENHLFRIAQEAMTNTLKHTQASTLDLKLMVESGQLQLQVSDNGQGFDPTVSRVGGYGVMGMQERSQQIGAQFQLTSCVGQGTIVRVIVPISAAALTKSP